MISKAVPKALVLLLIVASMLPSTALAQAQGAAPRQARVAPQKGGGEEPDRGMQGITGLLCLFAPVIALVPVLYYSLRLQRRNTAHVDEALGLQRRSNELQEESIAIQRESAALLREVIRQLDRLSERRLGGL
jgi:hypothetical protein